MKKYVVLALFCFFGLQAQQQNKTAFVYFDFNSDALTPQANAMLDSITATLQGYEVNSLKIYGFTDDAGTDSYNNVLAQKRADRVAAYFQLHKLTVAEAGPDSPTLRQAALPAEQKRRARIEYGYTLRLPAISGVSTGVSTVNTSAVTGIEGTQVTLTGAKGPGSVSVKEYFSTESMIANGMYGIAEGGDILKSDGMICVCNDYMEIDSTGLYTIKVPAYRGVLNDKATVWQSVPDNKGRLVWKETSIAVTTDTVTNTYTIKMSAKPRECTHINLDMFANKANGYRVVYLYTDKPYDLSNVRLYRGDSEMSFSAKLNDTTYAFSVRNRTPLAGLRFVGNTSSSRAVGVQLRLCKHKVDKKRNHHYYITKRALTAGLPGEAEDKKNEGGWFSQGGWLRRLFS